MEFDEQKEKLESYIPKYDKISWKRKQKNIEKILSEVVEPLEEQIIGLMAEKAKAIDKAAKIREQMVLECIHPADELVPTEDDSIYCKFCEREIGVFTRHEETSS